MGSCSSSCGRTCSKCNCKRRLTNEEILKKCSNHFRTNNNGNENKASSSKFAKFWQNSILLNLYAIKKRKQYYDIGKIINAYSIVIIISIIYLLVVDHVFRIIGKPWGTCLKNVNDKNSVSWKCNLMWHFIAIPVCAQFCFTAYYFLKIFSNLSVDRFNGQFVEKLLLWNNIVLFAYTVLKIVDLWFSTIKEYIIAQQTILFITVVGMIGMTIFGLTCQYYLYCYNSEFENYNDIDNNISYPTTEEEIVHLVKQGNLLNKKIRVIGAKHSPAFTIYPFNDKLNNNDCMLIQLQNYNKILDFEEVKLNDNKEIARVRVQAGIVLGQNPDDPNSTWNNGLAKQITDKGYALSDTGGVIMQQIGGFTMMGCSGGCLEYDYYQNIYQLRIIDSEGNIQTFTRPSLRMNFINDNENDNKNDSDNKDDHNDDDNEYWGVVVSMGLCGIVSEIVIECEKTYNVIGSQLGLTIDDWKKYNNTGKGFVQDGDGCGKLDIFAPNKEENSLYNYFMSYKNTKNTFARFFWWPQLGDDKDRNKDLLVAWKAHRVNENEDKSTKQFSKCFDKNGKLKNIPYLELPGGWVGDLTMGIVQLLYEFFDDVINKTTNKFPQSMLPILKGIINAFASGPGNSLQVFCGSWYKIVPMDQAITMPMNFSEIWVNIEDTDVFLNCVKEYFNLDDRLNHKGTFSWEIYCSKYDKAWIRANYKQNVIRLDGVFFDIPDVQPYTFWNDLWEYLAVNRVRWRPHWGKYNPIGDQPYPTNEFETWSDYYKSQFPKWEKFLQLRQKMDPKGLFITNYWARMFGLKEYYQDM